MKKQTLTKTFCSRIDEIRNEAVSKLKKAGGKVFYDVDENDIDELYDLPQITYVGKYFDYYTYAVVSYEVKNNELVFHGIETMEDNDRMEFNEVEVETITLCQIADDL